MREYVGRDWTAREAGKRAHWATVYRRSGWTAVWNAAQSLLTHVRAIRPGFPDDRSRVDDMAHHLALKDRIDRAADALTRR